MTRRLALRRTLVVILVVAVGLTAGAVVRYPAAAVRLVAHIPVLGPPTQAFLANRFGAGQLVEHEHEGIVDYWTCSMHPSVRHLEPGTCPICSMDLVPVYKPGMDPAAADAVTGEMSEMHMDDMPGMGSSPTAPGGTPGERATFQIDPTWQQAIGVTTETVRRRSLRESLRTVGRVTYDESRLVDVNLRVSGWIEKLLVAETGQLVGAGDPLFELYSPELVSTQGEYLLARDNAARLAASPESELRQRAESLLQTTRRRLELWGLTPLQIQQLDAAGEVVDSMPILSPAAGYVVEKNAVQGMRVDPGMRLYRIADLSTVWVIADVYASELSFVGEGMRATMSLAYATGRSWAGRIDYVYPTIERDTRTVQVRLVFANTDLALRPNMYGEVVLDAVSGPVVTVASRSHHRPRVAARALRGSGWRQAAGPRGPHRARGRRHGADPRRGGRRRVGRHVGQLPGRRREQDPGHRAAAGRLRGDAMIERLIEASVRNRLLTVLLIAFAAGWGAWALDNTPLAAIPDVSDVQVIIHTSWPGRSPDLIEDQITYPVVNALLSAPRVRVVRGQSMFGDSFVYVIFEDGTNMYWARSRVLEYMNEVTSQLPEGVTPKLGPDATAIGWVFEYALVDRSGKQNLADLRSFQDWHLRYWLESVPGVAEVAAVGGFVRQYQVDVDPNKLLAYGLPLGDVIQKIRDSNNDVGGKVIEYSGFEYFVRGRGYIHSVGDIEKIAIGVDADGTPVRLSDVATVQIGGDLRRGVAELDGQGEVVGGIVMARYGANALDVIDAVKERIREVQPGFPEGVELVVTYDRSDLIHNAIESLRDTLLEEGLIVTGVVLLFLLHVRSALVPILILPIAALIAFIPMYFMGLTANIMSLGGIAVALGAMVDAAIVMIENGHKHVERADRLPAERRPPRTEIIIAACREVGPALFFSLLVITVSFLPVFALEAQEGRLFRPLAYTKTFSMFFAAVLSVTLAPVLMASFLRGRARPESRHPISRLLIATYEPIVRGALRWRKTTVISALLLVMATVPIYRALGNEFMPPLNEGTILYMPTAVPGMAIAEARQVVQTMNRILVQVPEVERAFGKMGRADTATDPAPLSMNETVVMLKPKEQWRPGMTWERLINEELDPRLRFPGMPNIWWMPIQTRVMMLTTGIRSNLAIKVFGDDLETIEQVAVAIEETLNG